ncbi:MAG: RDD family protein [Pseudomonadales bacterium]|nr:RDD family protein [Pseudomonadales bacterium]
MTPWTLLQIDPTDDSRAIKRAYAKQLKQHRPDQDPQGFQRLHQAYKQAMAMAEREQQDPPVSSFVSQSLPETEPPPAPNDDVDTDFLRDAENNPPPPSHDAFVMEAAETESPPQPPPREIHRVEPLQEEAPAADDPEQVKAELLAQCAHTLSQSAALSRPQHWQFLVANPLILETAFNRALGQAVFRLIVDRQRPGWAVPQRQVLAYLNDLFHWTGQRRELLASVGEDNGQWLFDLLDAAPSQEPRLAAVRGGQAVTPTPQPSDPQAPASSWVYAGYGWRALCVLMDLLFVMFAISLLVIGPLKMISGEAAVPSGLWLTLGSLVAYLLMALVLECTPLQATPAKYLLGFRVVNKNGQRLHPLHNLWRITALLLLVGLLWKVIFLINAFMGGRLLHDRLSQSFVIRPSSASGGD